MIFRILLIGAALALAACAGDTGPEGPPGPAGPAGPQGPQGPAGEAAAEVAFDARALTCTECHNETTVIWSKEAQFREASVHGTGEAFIRGERGSCAGCHGHEGSEARIAAGLPPHDPSVEGVVNVSPFDCRTCHNTHITYTAADWALTGDGQAVALEYTSGTFDKGAGNLCANCHQIRNEIPTVANGEITFETTRFGPHHGVEANMLLGEGALLSVSGAASPHYEQLEDGCVSCHMGEEANHTYEPELERCVECHGEQESFDIDGQQTEIATLLEEVRTLLIGAGIIDLELDPEGNRSVPGTYPEAVAGAMWNYMLVLEDQSLGAHNPAYATALLEAAKAALEGGG